MQKKLAACKGDEACMKKVMGLDQSMQDFQQQLTDLTGGPRGAMDAIRRPCSKTFELTIFRCRSVTVTVSDAVDEQDWDRKPTGIPGSREMYQTRSRRFSYSGEAKGRLLYTDDFSFFSLITTALPETIQISEFSGYEQWYEWVPSGKSQVLRREDLKTAGWTIHTPFGLSIYHSSDSEPSSEASITELKLSSVHVLLPDGKDQYGSGLPDADAGDTRVTPEMMRQFVQARGFERTYQWRFDKGGEKSLEDHRLRIRVEIGEAITDDTPPPPSNEGPEPNPEPKPGPVPEQPPTIVEGPPPQKPPKKCGEEGAEELTLTMIEPLDNQTFKCDKESPRELIVSASAVAYPPGYDALIEWHAGEIGGAKATPTPATGPKTDVMYKDLPLATLVGRSDPIEIIAQIDVDRCHAKAEKAFYYYNDDCCATAAYLYYSQQLLNAYSDPNLLQQAKQNNWTYEQTKQAVVNQVTGQQSSGGGSGSGGGASVGEPMETNRYCDICIFGECIGETSKTEEQILNSGRQQYTNKHFPSGAFDADYAHEKVHAKTCGNGVNLDKPENYIADEIKAYTATVQSLTEWLAKHCSVDASKIKF